LNRIDRVFNAAEIENGRSGTRIDEHLAAIDAKAQFDSKRTS
jgi:hypothetical protein